MNTFLEAMNLTAVRFAEWLSNHYYIRHSESEGITRWFKEGDVSTDLPTTEELFDMFREEEKKRIQNEKAKS